MATYEMFSATDLIGATKSLAAVDGAALVDGDCAIIFIPATWRTYFYALDSDSAASESSPAIIEPDANGGDKRWILTHVYASVLGMIERGADPAEPAEGEGVIWMSDGTGKGDDGDIMIASQAGGVTKYVALFDHSAGGAW